MSSSLRDKALACRDAAATVAGLDTEAKRRLLHAMADTLAADEAMVLDANARDMEAARNNGTASPNTRNTFFHDMKV